MLIDLQFHSTYSDGYLTPTELVKFISKQGVKIASLTDHNTVRGLNEFRTACKKYKIKAITGIEIYTKLNNHKFNILWYNFNDNDPELHNILRDSQLRRRKQFRILLKKLVEKGYKININKIIDKYNHYTPLNHIVDDFISIKSNFNRIKKELNLKNPREGDIIKEYFHNKQIKKLQNSYISIERILKLRKKIGGQLIICHPAKYNNIKFNFFEKLKNLGIDGVEIFSPHHSYGSIIYLQHLAREFNFITTGGSDFHRFEGSAHKLQYSWQYFKIDSNYLRKINKIISK